MTCPQSFEDSWGAPGEALRHSQKQVPLASESLHKQTGRDACLGRNIRQREFMRTAPSHSTLDRLEQLVITYLPLPGAHGLLDRILNNRLGFP
jgi:hypothetical protein